MVELIASVSTVLEYSKYVCVWFRDKLTVILNSVEGLLLNVELNAIFVKYKVKFYKKIKHSTDCFIFCKK